MASTDIDLLDGGQLPRPVAVEPRAGLRIWVRFDDGESGEVDLSCLQGDRWAKALEDRTVFESVHVDSQSCDIAWAWDNGLRIRLWPEWVYAAVTGKALDDPLFSAPHLILSDPRPSPRPTEVEPRAGLRIWVRFDDGESGEVDLSHLEGEGVFKAWDDRALFESVYIHPEFETPSWGVGDGIIDLCSDALYMEITGKTLAEHMPALAGC